MKIFIIIHFLSFSFSFPKTEEEMFSSKFIDSKHKKAFERPQNWKLMWSWFSLLPTSAASNVFIIIKIKFESSHMCKHVVGLLSKSLESWNGRFNPCNYRSINLQSEDSSYHRNQHSESMFLPLPMSVYWFFHVTLLVCLRDFANIVIKIYVLSEWCVQDYKRPCKCSKNQ